MRGLAHRVLPPGEHGSGARALLRPRELDMFALGTREAVLAAVAGTDAALFGAPGSAGELAAALTAVGLDVDSTDPRADVVAFAHGWRRTPKRGADGSAGFSPMTP